MTQKNLSTALSLSVHSPVCKLGVLFESILAMPRIMSIANMAHPLGTLLFLTALLVPVSFIASGIGAWMAKAKGTPTVVSRLVIYPWLYILAFLMVMKMAL